MPRKKSSATRQVPLQALLLRMIVPAVVAITVAFGALVYQRIYDTVLQGFDRKLITASALAGALIDADDHAALMAQARTISEGDEARQQAIERTPIYVRTVEILRDLRRDLALTYFYTQVPTGGAHVLYVMDANTDSDHALIGSRDTLPPETVAGIERTMAGGPVYVSPVEYQEQWGLLKAAAAPLQSGKARHDATMGADVNVSQIRIATQRALFMTAVIGLVFTLAAGLVVWLLVRRIARPVGRLNHLALRVAAGERQFDQPVGTLPEIGTLHSLLEEKTRKLDTDVAQARQAVREALARQDRSRLLALAQGDAGAVVLADDGVRRVVVAYAPPGMADEAQPLWWRGMASLTAKSSEPGLSPSTCQQMCGGGGLIVLDRAAGTISHYGPGRVQIETGAGVRLAVLANGETLAVGAGPLFFRVEGADQAFPVGGKG